MDTINMAFCEVSVDLDWSCVDPIAYSDESDSRNGAVRTKCFRCGQPACVVDSAIVANRMYSRVGQPVRVRICNDCLEYEPQDIRDRVHNARVIASGDPCGELRAI